MRPTEERSTYGYWDGDDRPDPLVAESAPEFVGQLRTLVQWSGLTLEEIEQLARANGDILPPSIVSAALSHNTLPPEELVVALVAALGDDDDMVELWASVLWRLEDAEAARHAAPHSVPPPVPAAATSMIGPVAGAAAPAASGKRQYSGGALAQAVQNRRHQNSWTGLHRGFQKGLRATGFGSKHGRWPAVAVGVTIFFVVAGVAWALASGDGDKAAQPRSNTCCVGGQGAGARSPGSGLEASPSGLPVMMPLPSASTKPSSTPRPSPPRNSPSPTQTQTQQQPQLTGNASSTCMNNGTDWLVNLSVTALLTGATSGNNPQGRAGKPGDLQSFTLNGDGSASFSGSASINVGSSGGLVTGSIDWSVTVIVQGAGSVTDSGTEAYSCGA